MDDLWKDRHHEPMPKQKNEDGYFEMMSRAVFAAGLNWRVIDKKWPGLKEAFSEFSIEKVAKFDQADIDRLMKDTRIVRNYKKVVAIVNNAQEVERLIKEFGSFANYISQTKKQGEEVLIKDLGKRFSFLGPSTATIFLFGVGEKPSYMN